jgi:hypothetical protein
MNLIEALVIDQPVAMILAGQTFYFAALMLQRTPANAVCHSNVKRSRAAADDVNEVLVILHAKSISLSSWTVEEPALKAKPEGPHTPPSRSELIREFPPR